MIFLTYIYIKVIFSIKRRRKKGQHNNRYCSSQYCAPYLEFLRHNCRRKQPTQVVCIPLLLRESKTLVVMWIPQEGVTADVEIRHVSIFFNQVKETYLLERIMVVDSKKGFATSSDILEPRYFFFLWVTWSY
jgi:hypothetical protein